MDYWEGYKLLCTMSGMYMASPQEVLANFKTVTVFTHFVRAQCPCHPLKRTNQLSHGSVMKYD